MYIIIYVQNVWSLTAVGFISDSECIQADFILIKACVYICACDNTELSTM